MSSIFFFFILLIIDLNTHVNCANKKVCEIKYGLNKMEAQDLINISLEKPINNSPIKCNFIGLEYDQEKKPISNKPIYACCQDIKFKSQQ